MIKFELEHSFLVTMYFKIIIDNPIFSSVSMEFYNRSWFHSFTPACVITILI